MESELGVARGDIEMIASSGGVFEVTSDGDLVFSKKATRRHAQPGEVVNAIRARAATG